MGRSAGRPAVLVFLGLSWAAAAQAHVGPPFPIVENQAAGPYIVSVWAHPDIGVGVFYVILDAGPGATLPEKNDVQVCVQPLDGRLPERCYPAEREATRDRVQYDAQVEFDQRDHWRLRVTASGANGEGEVRAEVESTPPGLGVWDLLLYGFPFILFGGLWLLVALRRGRRRRRGVAVAAPTANGAAAVPAPEASANGTGLCNLH